MQSKSMQNQIVHVWSVRLDDVNALVILVRPVALVPLAQARLLRLVGFRSRFLYLSGTSWPGRPMRGEGVKSNHNYLWLTNFGTFSQIS